ncbi:MULTISPECIES: fumarylacetoacetate hydrolase family protein [Glycomyces]|uniref:2-keto-4-pentenoate hydratase/2-oxohepta-3-ene-1,7-dioic acid hydratase in catechol pathway n=2 Tax=Glycomyces TaxID=58113 RepID=A0A9X3SWP0_9ACTN|nr:fumarylacetoacetate hydrolase family protein [Glycomyces lechevalierae]MDA1386057.1 fumarylacetoacetate hydrolase family protein [Glycomyces lechevalierae]MDR7340785.1 2-keto-4-pentenoate hydratase/2-oxohepta-3-ene-1,7-dioic acid hydratase in catechol pathway [Glycomyces lechevalierae]
MNDADVLPLPDEFATTAEVLGEGTELARRLLVNPAAHRVPLSGLRLLHPVPDARILCQGANYRSHMVESGMDPERAFNMLFTKSTASLAGPYADIVRPTHVQLLDYEVELGIVLGKAITGPVTVTDEDLSDYIGAFVVANDVSARDIQLPQGQWYKGKSYRGFCPVGPYLCVPDPDEVGRWRELRLTLSVNGETRQDALAGDMAFGPAATLTEWSGLERLDVGDLLLTGTPGGVALQPPGRLVQRISALLPEEKRWELFVKGQAKSDAYLKPGDHVEAAIRTDDGKLDLGVHRNTVR